MIADYEIKEDYLLGQCLQIIVNKEKHADIAELFNVKDFVVQDLLRKIRN